MRALASTISLLFVIGCATGGGGGNGDAGRSTFDAAPAPDSGPMIRTDAGRSRDAGRVIRLPDAGGMSGGGCSDAADGTPCSDGDGCTSGDACLGGACAPGPLESCDDASACTTDACVATGADTFRCENTAGSCDDGDACTTSDACGPGGTCTGSPVLDGYEANDTRAAAHDLGSVSDGDGFPRASFMASLYPSGDEDWYQFHDSDDFGGLIYPRVDLKNIPSGSDYELCAYFRCDSSLVSVGCESGTSRTFEGLPGCCSTASGSANESVRLNPDCSGSDDSGAVFVRIYHFSGAPTCASYTLDWGDD